MPVSYTHLDVYKRQLQTGLKYFGIKYPLDYSGNASTGKEKIRCV